MQLLSQKNERFGAVNKSALLWQVHMAAANVYQYGTDESVLHVTTVHWSYRMLFSGPCVEVGVTMYVLSISSLSEVQMVHITSINVPYTITKNA
jgi:hypothetical protein